MAKEFLTKTIKGKKIRFENVGGLTYIQTGNSKKLKRIAQPEGWFWIATQKERRKKPKER